MSQKRVIVEIPTNILQKISLHDLNSFFIETLIKEKIPVKLSRSGFSFHVTRGRLLQYESPDVPGYTFEWVLDIIPKKRIFINNLDEKLSVRS